MSMIQVTNPATGAIIKEIKKNTPEEIELALEKGQHAFKKNGLRSMPMNVPDYYKHGQIKFKHINKKLPKS